MTTLHHVALVRTSEAGAESFFAGLLGLARVRETSASAELSRTLFGVSREHRMLVYEGPGLRVEVFLAPEPEAVAGRISHLCLEVPDRAAFVERARTAGVEVREAERGAGTVVFLADEDGNLYEIKQSAAAV